MQGMKELKAWMSVNLDRESYEIVRRVAFESRTPIGVVVREAILSHCGELAVKEKHG